MLYGFYEFKILNIDLFLNLNNWQHFFVTTKKILFAWLYLVNSTLIISIVLFRDIENLYATSSKMKLIYLWSTSYWTHILVAKQDVEFVGVCNTGHQRLTNIQKTDLGTLQHTSCTMFSYKSVIRMYNI